MSKYEYEVTVGSYESSNRLSLSIKLGDFPADNVASDIQTAARTLVEAVEHALGNEVKGDD
jgi:hypothetical protein